MPKILISYYSPARIYLNSASMHRKTQRNRLSCKGHGINKIHNDYAEDGQKDNQDNEIYFFRNPDIFTFFLTYLPLLYIN